MIKVKISNVKDFRNSDIENQNTYHIKLIPTVNGSGKNVKSSFYITLEKKDSEGNVLVSKQIGSPDIVRKGVYNYKIERIFCDKAEQNLIFVIEKMMEAKEQGQDVRVLTEELFVGYKKLKEVQLQREDFHRTIEEIRGGTL